MIKRMHVEDFKALRHVEVDLEPFTVLIGPNDTGKSSFLEAVYAFSESTRSPLANCFWSSWQNRELVWNRLPDKQVRLSGVLGESSKDSKGNAKPNELTYSLWLGFATNRQCRLMEERVGISATGKGEEVRHRTNSAETTVRSLKDGHTYQEFQDRLSRVVATLSPPILARWDVEELATPSRLPPNRNYPFDPSGYGLATCIAEMKLGAGGQFESLRKDFCEQFPGFKDIVIQRADVQSVERTPFFEKHIGSRGEGYALVLVRTDGIEIPAGLASGGTLVTLAFLTLIHLPEPRKLLLIEEPENGLHPGRLKEVITILRRLVAARNDTQVIITTHSPLLLDFVEPNEVRVFLRNKNDDVEVFNVADVPDIGDRLKYLMLGELIYNEGEEELVKEIRQHESAHSGRGAD